LKIKKPKKPKNLTSYVF